MKLTAYRISNLFEYAAAIVVLLMMLHITLDVIAKYAFNHPLPGTLPIVAHYYMVAVVFLPLAFVEINKESIAVDLFYQWFPGWMKYFATLLGTVCSITFFSVLAYQSYHNAKRAFGTGEFVDGTYLVITWPSRFLLPLSFASVVVVLLLRLFHELRHGDSPMKPPSQGFESEASDEGKY